MGVPSGTPGVRAGYSLRERSVSRNRWAISWRMFRSIFGCSVAKAQNSNLERTSVRVGSVGHVSEETVARYGRET